MESRYTVSIKLAAGFLAGLFAWQVFEAARQPVGSREAYLYDRFVRPTVRQSLAAELPNRDVLYSLLAKRSVGLFHVSPFSVRLPSLLFAILYYGAVWQVARRFLGADRLFLPAVLLAGGLALYGGWFTRAAGTGAALALLLCATSATLSYLINNQYSKENRLSVAGACFGLSVAARLEFAVPATALLLAFLPVLAIRRRWVVWTDRLLIPALVMGLIFLVLPLSHAHATAENTPELTAEQAAHLQSALDALHSAAGADRIRIGATASAEPVVNFYRAQHRVTSWQRAERHIGPEHLDYYLLPAAEAGTVVQRHLIVLYRDVDFLVARWSYAAL